MHTDHRIRLPDPGLWQERSGDPALQESLDSVGSLALSVVSVLASVPQLFFLWSPRGKTIFSAGYREIIEETPDRRGGCLAYLKALIVIAASFTSYVVLMIAILNTLVVLGLIRSS